jgi:hypothetical protein
LSCDGTRCIGADYSRRGVACYDSFTGQFLWHRKDTRRVQRLSLTRDGLAIHCEGDNRPTQKLDLQSGQTLVSLRGVKEITESPYAPVIFLEKAVCVLESDDGRQIAKIPVRASGILLSTAFSPKRIGHGSIEFRTGGFLTTEGSEKHGTDPIGKNYRHVGQAGRADLRAMRSAGGSGRETSAQRG